MAPTYPTMSLKDIAALRVKDICAKDAALLIWATSPLLPEALHVMEAWGFKFKTVAFCWSKMTSTGKDVVNLGQWTLGNVEICLLGTRGAPRRVTRSVRQLVRAERTHHSCKPDEVRARIGQIFGDVPKLELFARSPSPGWAVWGNEVSGAEVLAL